MRVERPVLWVLRWLALLTIALALVQTGLLLFQKLREMGWSLRWNTTQKGIDLIEAAQRNGNLILFASLVWILGGMAERQSRASPPTGPEADYTDAAQPLGAPDGGGGK